MLTYTQGITKQEFVAEMELHKTLDNFIKGTYDDGEKGCAVGCAVKSINKLKGINPSEEDGSNYHLALEEAGICPKWLAQVEDKIFERLELEDAKQWPVDFAKAIPEGVDLDQIKVPFLCYILEQNIATQEENLARNKGSKELEKVIKLAIKVNKDMIIALQSGSTEVIQKAESLSRSAAGSAARAAESVSVSAARLAVGSAARSAAYLVSNSVAWSVAWSAESAARLAVKAAFYKNCSIKLLTLIKECV